MAVMLFSSLAYPSALSTYNVTYVMTSFSKPFTQFFHHGRSDPTVHQPQIIWNLWKNS